MAGHEDVEVQGLYQGNGVDPVGEVGIREIHVGESVHGDEVDGEQRAFLWKEHDDHVVRVGPPHVDELDGLAAQPDGHAFVEREIGDRRGTLLADDGGAGVHVGHHGGLVGEHLAARDVIPVVVTVDEILDRQAEA